MKKIIYAVFLFSTLLALTNCGGSEKEASTKGEKTEEKTTIATTEEMVEINGVNHFIKKMGKGEPLLVLHGGPGLFHNYLIPHFEVLAENYEIIFYDQRGCGKTDFPNDTLGITLATYVQDLETIRTHLGIEKLNLIGHSWGSLLAMTYAKKYPNNLNRLVLISPAPVNSDFYDQTLTNAQQKRSENDMKELVKTMMSAEFEKRDEKAFKKAVLLGDKVNLADQETVNDLYQPMNFSVDAANNLMLVSSLLERTFFNLNATEGLENITVPTLIITGDLDNVPFSSTQAIHDNIKGSQLEVIKKSCHYPFFESPKAFNSVIKGFLNPAYEQ